MARTAFEPTQEQRKIVSIMTACGMPQDFICQQIINHQTGKPVDGKTLRRAFAEEIADSLNVANAHVAQALFKKAVGTGPQSVTAAIFWLKCRAQWKPTEGLELTGKDGAPLPGVPTLSEGQFERLAKKIADEV